jgi:hypothetical protein
MTSKPSTALGRVADAINSFRNKLRLLIAVFCGTLSAVVSEASASTVTVDFTAEGGSWIQSVGTSGPWGLPSNPTIISGLIAHASIDRTDAAENCLPR